MNPRPTNPGRRLRGGFSLGGQAAEADLLLKDAFYETDQYRAVASHDDRRCFLIGRTGSGKSAILQELEDRHPGQVIRIEPENLSLPYITDLGVVKYLSDMNIRLDPLFNALWKHVLLIEIIRHRYKVDSPDTKFRCLRTIREKLRRDKSRQAAIRYLEEFEGKFWQETDQRVRQITTTFEKQANAEAKGSLALGGLGATAKAGSGDHEAIAERQKLVNRFQRIVNETQLPRLNQMLAVLDENILDSPRDFTYVVIDDLDRDWADEKIANILIRNLFQAVLSLQRVQNLKVLVALRTNIFDALDFGRTGGQEERFRAQILRITWTRADLIEVLDRRVLAAAARRDLDGLSGVSDLLVASSRTRGNMLDYILDRTLMRPRDAIAFLNECLALASGRENLTWTAIHAGEAAYSNNRLLALRDEWKHTFPGIERVLRTFTGSDRYMRPDALRQQLDDCALLVADRSFEGAVWMTECGLNPILNGMNDWAENYQSLIRLLYHIGFLGCGRPKSARNIAYSHDEPDFADRVSNIRDAPCFVIHPAFRPALEIGTG